VEYEALYKFDHHISCDASFDEMFFVNKSIVVTFIGLVILQNMEELAFATSEQPVVTPAFNEATMLMDGTVPKQNFSISSIFSWNYYKQFFNVTTDDIIERVKLAINPRDKKFLSSQDQPELYGPIWATITSGFVSMVFGNLSAWITYGKDWKRSISHVFTAETICFIYTFLSPLLYRSLGKASNPPSVISLMGLFGYTLLFMIPISAARFIVGKKLDFIISIAGSLVAGYSIFNKLVAFYNDHDASMKMGTINLIYAGITILLIILVQYLCFKN
jgi:hypothetical protein